MTRYIIDDPVGVRIILAIRSRTHHLGHAGIRFVVKCVTQHISECRDYSTLRVQPAFSGVRRRHHGDSRVQPAIRGARQRHSGAEQDAGQRKA
jgi:hypothetical protein